MGVLYKIAHVDDPAAANDKSGKVFSPRGAVRKLWETSGDNSYFETGISGPAETGKTWGCINYLNSLAWEFPGSQHVMARKTYRDLVGSVVRTFQRATGAGPDSPIKPFGGQIPQWYDYPNGSRIWLAGLDRPGRALSSERDTIYVNQAEELILEDFETLTTRVTGRGAVMPWTRIFFDCNPGPPTHWIKRRPSIKLLESRHEDNPTLYDVVYKGGRAVGFKITPQGLRTLRILDNLTGVRKQRLRFGRWVQAEGVVYEGWDPARHLIDAMPNGWESWTKIRSIDFGFNNPFVCQWWAIDPDGRLYLYREIYKSRRIVEDHVNGYRDPDDASRQVTPGINIYSAGEAYEATVADHDAEDRATLARHGVATVPAYKNITDGIQAVEERLKVQPDGRPRLYIVRGCTVEIDDRLEESKLPVKTEQEFDAYQYPKKTGKTANEKNPKDLPIDRDNHGMDAMRYAVAYDDLQPDGAQEIVDEVEYFQ